MGDQTEEVQFRAELSAGNTQLPFFETRERSFTVTVTFPKPLFRNSQPGNIKNYEIVIYEGTMEISIATMEVFTQIWVWAPSSV